MSSPLDEVPVESGLSAKRAQAQQERWEERVTKRIITGMYGEGAQPMITDIAHKTKLKTGDARITFAAFYDRCRFPIWIFSRKIPWLHTMTPAQLWNDAKRISRVFFELEAELPGHQEGQPYGLAFEWLHSAGAIKLMHNYDGVTGVYGPRFQWPGKRPRKPMSDTITLENLDDFLRGVSLKTT